MKKLFSLTILHVSTLCQNHCAQCPLAGYKPAVAGLEYMKRVVDYAKSRSIFSIIDIAGKDITFNPHLVEFLEYCKRIGVITSATLGTPHSTKMARQIFELVDAPRISYDGPGFNDDYRGEGNQNGFFELMRIAEEAGALGRLEVIFTAIPDRIDASGRIIEGNVKPKILKEVIETIRRLGKGRTKLLVNPVNSGGYSETELALLELFGKQSCVRYSLSKQKLIGLDGSSKGCLCQAPRILTFSAEEELIAPCSLLPDQMISLKNGIDAAVRSGQWRTAAALCGHHKACSQCWASCYHLPGIFLQGKWKLIIPHLLSCTSIQNVRDTVLSVLGQIRLDPSDRFPNCPRLRERG